MDRTFAMRLVVSSLIVAGATVVSGCAVDDIPVDKNPIHTAAKAPPPISGGTLLISKSGLAIAADSDRDLVWVVDLGTKKVAKITLQDGDEPGRLAEDGAGRIHVALRGAGAVATVDTASGKIVGRTSVCSAPRGLAYDQVADAVHVACAGGELVTLPAAGGAPTRVLHFPQRDLRDVIVKSSGLLVTRYRSAQVLSVDSEGKFGPSKTPPSSINGFGSSFSPTLAWRAIPLPGGEVALSHQVSADQPVVISQPDGYGGEDPGDGCGGSIVNTTVTIIGANGEPTGAGSPAPTILGASVPVDIATDSHGNFAIASAGSESLFFTNTGAIDPASTGGFGCVSGGGVKLPGQPVAVAFSNQGWVAQLREFPGEDDAHHGARLAIVDSSGVRQVIELGGEDRKDTGHFLFHHDASNASHLACVSCHGEAHDDGHTWVFDTLGARRTQTVSGGVLDTAPLHWNGDMDDLGEIMHEVFMLRMGGAQQGPQHVEAFGKWINVVPAFPPTAVGTQTQIDHGKELFARADVACNGCHNGEHLTNNRASDIGTGQAFQVPTLIGVAARAPYMHDGCAKTLKDRFTGDPACTGGEQHGHVAQLSTSDIDDLVAYLETL